MHCIVFQQRFQHSCDPCRVMLSFWRPRVLDKYQQMLILHCFCSSEIPYTTTVHWNQYEVCMYSNLSADLWCQPLKDIVHWFTASGGLHSFTKHNIIWGLGELICELKDHNITADLNYFWYWGHGVMIWHITSLQYLIGHPPVFGFVCSVHGAQYALGFGGSNCNHNDCNITADLICYRILGALSSKPLNFQSRSLTQGQDNMNQITHMFCRTTRRLRGHQPVERMRSGQS